MAGKAGKITHLIFSVIFLLLSTAGFAVYSVMAVEFLSAAAVHSAEGGLSGLSAGIALVVMIIFGIPTGVVSVINLILSVFMIRRRGRGYKIYGIVATVLSALYFVCVAVGIPVLVNLHNSGVI